MKKTSVLFTLLPSLLFSQGIDPFNHYKVIRGENVKLIYSEEMKDEADTILSYIDYQNENNRKSVEGDLIDLPLLLHKDTTVSNGFVTPMPFRSEFYPTPPVSTYELGGTPWLIDLSIHEYRHALQMMQGREGINDLLYILGGEQLVAGANVLAIPTWYWEGDAVVQETALSKGGRGRLNYFLKGYRSILLEDKPFKYEKAKNGSYKDFVPNHYLLGYMLTSYGRYKYGYDFWKGIFSDATQYKGLLPLSSAIKDRTGLSSPEFYNAAFQWWKAKWQKELKDYDLYFPLVKTEGTYTTYGRSYDFGDYILTSKLSYEEPAKFVLVDKDMNEETILTKGISSNFKFRYKDDYILWDSYQADKFWSNKNYSNIYMYNIKDKKAKKITNKGKYFNPSINDKKDMIAASIIDYTSSQVGLAILDLDGNMTKFISDNDKLYLEPLWTDNDSSIITTAKNAHGDMALIKINLNDEKEEVLIPYGNYIIEDIFMDQNKIYFSATFDYVDNIYCVDTHSKNITKVTNSKYGAYSPSIVDGLLIFTEYQRNGYFIRETSPANNYEFTLKSLIELDEYNFDFFQDEGGNIVDKVKVNEYAEEDYKSYKNLINIHSWIYSYDGTTASLQLMSTNETTDLDINLAYNKNLDENTEDYSIQAAYTRYWPDVSLEYSKEGIEKLYSNKEFEFKLKFPLNLTEGFYSRSITPSISYISDDDNHNKVNSYKLALTFQNYIPGAYKNLNTKWGQALNLVYMSSTENEFDKIYLDGSLYTKGIGINDSFKLSLAYEQEEFNRDFNYSTLIDMPRGYSSVDSDNIYRLSLDYSLPLFYPDWGNNGFYLKRVRTDLFYDNSAYSLDEEDHSLDSIGTEIYFDTRLLSLVDFTFGVRYSYKLSDKDSVVDLIIPLQEFY